MVFIEEQLLLVNIIPVYKNIGSKVDSNNFRPITIISCFGKLFRSILNTRLNDFSDDFCLMCGYSTTDNLFILHMLVNIMKCKKKKLFCAFIEFALEQTSY